MEFIITLWKNNSECKYNLIPPVPKGQYLIKKMAQNSHVAQEIFSQKDSTRVRPREQRTVTHKCCLAGGWGCSQLPHLEVMFTHAVTARDKWATQLQYLLKGNQAQSNQDVHPYFPSALMNENILFQMEHEELKYSLKVSILYCEHQDSNYS